ncbi:maleylpyruvate isomerase family mycothiol-dependent enzyme [Actinocorallia sp. A-T 12471]|uniref:maleylpyruvate isomerase family mycothiol-dependent enzyme n=1 Tax=Actinocorallia sp. A-T 12471 TaxID=3089813 RepID=UPI0029D30161|nr:maleylpyruvate isomerase family mycothiol-dependent enzyme [Actinocorallia sp. A-T 12471]MDX6744486.1 maleylpyruvate isomerase family mycothiol-dependent enzyme [Actinocorallia sp. A-T 12471]
MDDAEIWRHIDAERASLADFLDALTPAQWATPSLCEGWTVREVAAHLTAGPTARLGDVLAGVVRARGNFDRFVDATARRDARKPTAEITATLRASSGSRRLALGQRLSYALLDILIHGQDIARPLGVARPMPLEAARFSTDTVYRMGFPFHARKRLKNVRLVATDIPWTAGQGPEATAPIASLLLLASGRRSAVADLTGPGTALLT